MEYKLVKTPTGKKFRYDIVDSTGKVLHSRTSARNYVSCTLSGGFFFGRTDLEFRGDHRNKWMRMVRINKDLEKAFHSQISISSFPYFERVMRHQLEGVETIVRLQPEQVPLRKKSRE